MRKKALVALVVGLFAIPVVAHAVTEFKKPYFMQHVPTVTGTVSAVSEHSFTVITDSGEHMTFHVDSRTLMPARLTTETRVMLEHAMMENGDHRAVRVMPIGEGELPAAVMEGDRPRADADWDGIQPAAMGDESGVGYEPASTSGDAETYGDDVADDADGTGADAHADHVAQNQDVNAQTDTDADRDELPSTASPWPIVQLAGGFAVAAGAGMLLFRRRRR